MIKQIRNSLTTTILAVVPFLLSGCGPEDDNNKRVMVPMVVVLALIFSVVANRARPAVSWAVSRRGG